jgi:hypothetical protein
MQNILGKQHLYKNMKDNMEILKIASVGRDMDTWEYFNIYKSRK